MLKSPLTSVLNGFNIKMYFPINLRPEIPILNGLYSLCTLNDKEQRLLEGVLTLKTHFLSPHFLNRKPHWKMSSNFFAFVGPRFINFQPF